jgi:hypothetical protein
MKRRHVWVRQTALGALAVVLGGVAAAASAANLPFTYRKGGIPDLDQTRQIAGGHFGLPGDGNNYCVPTSAMDCLAYIANHGYGWMEPNGYRNWQAQNLYDSAGIEIWKMGQFMNTDAGTGTTGDNHLQGIKDWFDSWGLLSDFTVTAQFASGTSSPTPNDLADAGFAGGLVMPIIGWYSLAAGQYTRVGGHCLAMNKLVGVAGPAYTISWRDPAADDGVFTTQSPFSTGTYTLTAVSAMFNGSNRTQYRVVGFNSGTNAGFLDGYVVITPKHVLTTAPGDFEFDLYDLSSLVDNATVHVAAPGGIRHAALHAAMTSVAYLTLPDGNQRSDLRVLDPNSGHMVIIQELVPGAMKVAVGRNRRAYVLADGGIRLLGYDLDRAEAPYDASLPQYMNTLAYDDRYDLVYVLCTGNPRLVQCTADLAVQNDVQLPAGLSLNIEAPLAVSPVTSNLWIASQWASELYEIGVDQDGVATLLSQFYDPDLYDAVGLAVDERDHVFVSTNRGTGLEFAGGTGNWQRVSPSVLDGRAFGPLMAVSFSRSNFNVATMTGPGYENVLPTDFAPPVYDGAPSTFDTDGDGWKIVGFNGGYPPPAFGELEPTWLASGGNPDGAIEATDVFAETFFAAPDKLLGDLTSLYGGTLTFDILILGSDNAAYPAVILAGASKFLYYDALPTEEGVWTARTIPLTEGGWRVGDWQGPDASADDLREVLGDVRGLYINAEWHTGPDDTLLDNVYLNPVVVPAVCAGDGNCDGVVNWRDIDYLVAAQNDNQTAWAALFAPASPACGFLNLDTSGDGAVNWRDIDPFIALMNTTCP